MVKPSNKLLHADESILLTTQKHWIIFINPLLWTILTGIFLLLPTPFFPATVGAALFNSIADLAWIPASYAGFSWLKHLMRYLTTRWVLTQQRIIMRTGFFFQHSQEIRLANIAAINLHQSLLGRLLNYGTVTLHSFGGNADIFTSMASAQALQKQISAQLP